MEIHSSSLTFSPIGHSQQQVGKSHAEQEKAKTGNLSAPEEVHNPQYNRVLSSTQVKILDNAGLSPDMTDRYNTYKPTDTRILKALNAYNLEINRSLLDQRVELMTGIDTYV